MARVGCCGAAAAGDLLAGDDVGQRGGEELGEGAGQDADGELVEHGQDEVFGGAAGGAEAGAQAAGAEELVGEEEEEGVGDGFGGVLGEAGVEAGEAVGGVDLAGGVEDAVVGFWVVFGGGLLVGRGVGFLSVCLLLGLQSRDDQAQWVCS
ncbi:predicted protein [Aspergillus terreus NIH2624]|uniref:Uncharacterized protein n=1 Tax=Aspergillus terreus (strain NIH 2624 / FGSC A1156) TaxID=341663 RepID=Q0CY65_ASPTN|nr:uncharacterized protein ATEG_01369 [Aspergillus terreus NIH2624]EAU38126.1 predicted protein [Aspergillus terreus NIH2624]